MNDNRQTTKKGDAKRRCPLFFPAAKACLVLVLLALTLTIAACHGGRNSLPAGIVARVNDQNITLSYFERQFAAGQKGAIDAPPNEVVDELAVRSAFLDQLIEQILVVQLGRRLDITVSKKEIDRIYRSMQSGYQSSDFARALSKGKLDEATLKKKIEYSLIADKVAARAVLPSLQVGEEEVKAYYEAHREQFSRAETIHARQIVLSSEEEGIAALTEVLTGKPFAQVAENRSIAPERVRGGDLGFFTRGEMLPEIEEEAFQLEQDQVSNLIETDFGFHIIQILEKKPAASLTFEQAQDTIYRQLRREKADQAWRDLIAGLKAEAKIIVDRRRLLGL